MCIEREIYSHERGSLMKLDQFQTGTKFYIIVDNINPRVQEVACFGVYPVEKFVYARVIENIDKNLFEEPVWLIPFDRLEEHTFENESDATKCLQKPWK
jgi:hypothetical protein